MVAEVPDDEVDSDLVRVAKLQKKEAAGQLAMLCEPLRPSD
jgi:hypothetical protein